MKVREAIEILKEMDPDATILIAIQPHWPFEYTVAGIAKREWLKEYQGEEDYERRKRDHYKDNDVILCQGTQICYGDGDIWEVARDAASATDMW